MMAKPISVGPIIKPGGAGKIPGLSVDDPDSWEALLILLDLAEAQSAPQPALASTELQLQHVQPDIQPVEAPYQSSATQAAADHLIQPVEAPYQSSATQAGADHHVPPELLDPQTQLKFVNDLPIATRIHVDKPGVQVIEISQTTQWLGLTGEDGEQLQTTVWGYGLPGQDPTYPGPTLVAHEGVPTTISWHNKLPRDGLLLPVDTTIHWADPEKKPLADGYVPIVTHLHGGHTASESDGLPDAWFTQNGSSHGPGYDGPISTYDNDQDAATLWYHDHALGLTRLNVYSGLSGFYLLEDDNSDRLVRDGVLPGSDKAIEMAIQDRAFTEDGQLYLPAYKDDPLPGDMGTVGDMVPDSFYAAFGYDAPSVVPEFFGDHILVNGMAWPNLDVAAGDYLFHLLNGSDSRFYVLKLSDADVTGHLVGVDGGLLPHAITIFDGDGSDEPDEFLVLAPGDRLDVVFEFGGNDVDKTVTLLNVGPVYEPFKGLSGDGPALAEGAVAATVSDPVGSIMTFTVDETLKADDASVTTGTELVSSFVYLATDDDHNGVADLATNVRRLGLFEGADDYGRITPMLGTAEAGAVHSSIMAPDGNFGPLMWDAPVTETPQLGSIEQWDIFNFTADAHPIHLHLVQFQVVSRHLISFEDSNEDGIPDDHGDGSISYSDTPDVADPDIDIDQAVSIAREQTGWQDTVYVAPGEMLSIVAAFDRPGDYVWHCHILSHEDNEMMRPFSVVGQPASGSSEMLLL